MKSNSQYGFRDYLFTLFKYTKKQLPLTFALVFAASLTEGIGLMLLLPLLAIIGMETGATVNNPIVISTKNFFSGLGIPLELTFILIIFVLLVVVRSGLIFFRDTYLHKVQLEFVDAFRSGLHKDIGGATWLFLMKKRTSDLSHVLTSDISRIGLGTHLLFANSGFNYNGGGISDSFFILIICANLNGHGGRSHPSLAAKALQSTGIEPW